MQWMRNQIVREGQPYLLALGLACLLVVLSAWLRNATGIYGFSLYGPIFAFLAWWMIRPATYFCLVAVWLILSYYILEGEGFAISDPDDAQRMVMMLTSTVPIIYFVGHIRERYGLMTQALEITDRNYQDTLMQLNELTHRVGNDLSTLSAVTNLQASNTTDPLTQEALHKLRDRIHVFSSLYRKLGFGVSQKSELDAPAFLAGLCHDLQKLHQGLRPISVDIEAAPVTLTPHRAMLAGIMLNESVTNAFKYAFPDNRVGHIQVHLSDLGDGELCLSVQDDGVGGALLNPQGHGMGQRIMQAMSSQLRGTYSLSRVDNHTVSKVCFPVK